MVNTLNNDLITDFGLKVDYEYKGTVLEKKVSEDGVLIKKNMPEHCIALKIYIYDKFVQKTKLVYLKYAFDAWLFLKDKKTGDDIFALDIEYNYLGLTGVDAVGGFAGIVSKLDFDHIYNLEFDSSLSREENVENMTASWMNLSQVERYGRKARIIEP